MFEIIKLLGASIDQGLMDDADKWILDRLHLSHK